ncbi:hypothetical protein PYW08_010511 [Mythimna loreyi]|uniref:Uncharacterized protein n=1 Tax=Mythimna loreyi TaxID=667449 RepID=A0ACC2Q9V1_9NEOP|nr:hypothetical protein PYW08_010511 [Mythimna loreyi]
MSSSPQAGSKPGSPTSTPKAGSPTGSPPKSGSPTPGSPKAGSPTPASPKSPSGKSTPESVKSKKSPTSQLQKAIGSGGFVPQVQDEEYYTRPDFIYGGPFIAVKLPSPFLDIDTPRLVPLQGTFRKSFAYYSLKERLPVILTKIIDYLSREKEKIIRDQKATEEDVVKFMREVTKLKNDLVTNKEYAPLKMKSPDTEKWNLWIENQDNKKYFLNNWMFTECYVYRRLKEGCELTKTLKNFDYFEEQKRKAFQNNIEIMCLVADRMADMIAVSEPNKRKADFVTLLKLCLWANRCDLSLSLGSQVDLIQAAKDATEKLRLNPPPPPPTKGKGKKGKNAAPAGPIIISADPFQMIVDLKDKTIADDSNKIADQVVNKAAVMMDKVVAAQQALAFKTQCSCNRLAKQQGMPICEDPTPKPDPDDQPLEPPPPPPAAEGEGGEGAAAKPEPPKIPCPAKLTVPQTVMFDIVCDNAGYELFADMCLAHFLIEQKIVQKIRFHVKNMPWFVSDVTVRDFKFLIEACCNAQFSQPSSTGAVEEDGTPKVIKSDNLKVLGEQWKKYADEGIFLVMDEDFWTYPHCFKEMKKIDPNLYRKLQLAVAIMFKGDLNYRKLMGDVNANPYLKLQASLQGFLPAPIIAVRTVKSETICGLPKGRWDLLNQRDPKWMQTGDYGVLQWCPKGEALKVSDRPCIDYCTKCFGIICPEHLDM